MQVNISPGADPAAFGRALRAYREQYGLTRAAMAAQAGCSPFYVARLEQGRAGLTFERQALKARRLAALMDTPAPAAARAVPEGYLTTRQAAERLGLNQYTIVRWISRGELPAQETHKYGRLAYLVPVAAVEARAAQTPAPMPASLPAATPTPGATAQPPLLARLSALEDQLRAATDRLAALEALIGLPVR